MSRPRRAHLIGAVVAALALPALLPAAAIAGSTCDDLLVTHRPDGSTGDRDAVTVTTQTLDRDTDGWAMVGWEVAPGTELRSILAVSDAGVTELPPTATLAEGGILELQFCGATGAQTATELDTQAPVGAADDDSTNRIAAVSAGATRADGALGTGFLGAAVGAAIGGVVLLLSRGSRRSLDLSR